MTKKKKTLLVAKIGTDTLISNGQVDLTYADHVAEQVCALQKAGITTVLVSSGERVLGDQKILTNAWEKVFQKFGKAIVEVLFTDQTIDEGMHAIRNALKNDFLPLVNGDRVGKMTSNNDILAAKIACSLNAFYAAFLTQTEGVLNHQREVISHLLPCEDIVSFASSQNGTGGIVTKVQAAREAAQGGRKVLIANGRRPNVLLDFTAQKTGFGTRIGV